MPSLQPQEEVVAGDERIHYQELNVEEEDLKLRVDQFSHKVFITSDATGEKFSVLPKMIKCALALCHLIADVERSISINKKVVTKQNASMKREIFTGLRSLKAAVQGYGGVDKVPFDNEPSKITREAKEAIHIQRLDPNLNRNIGKMSIPHCFGPLISAKPKNPRVDLLSQAQGPVDDVAPPSQIPGLNLTLFNNIGTFRPYLINQIPKHSS